MIDEQVIGLVLRLALLLSSEGTTDARRPGFHQNQQVSGLLNSTLAFMPRFYAEHHHWTLCSAVQTDLRKETPTYTQLPIPQLNDNDLTFPH
jgi:hypothetical protein